LLCSCSIFTEDLTEAKRLGAEKKYAEAIALLDHFKSGNSKKYNAQLRVEYGVDVLRNLDESKSERHQLAKTLFEEAVRLDPKNTKARTFYLTLLKTTHNEDLTE
jgi:tetratricopeptide (TPR) repeat protein